MFISITWTYKLYICLRKKKKKKKKKVACCGSRVPLSVITMMQQPIGRESNSDRPCRSPGR